jgi:hypothetical protein
MLRRQKAWPIPAYWREGRLVDLLHAGVKFRSSSLGANPAFTGRSLCLPHCIDSEWEWVMRASYANEAPVCSISPGSSRSDPMLAGVFVWRSRAPLRDRLEPYKPGGF